MLLAVGAAAMLAMAQGASTQPVTVAEVPHVQGEAIIDGTLDDAIWRDALRVVLDIETGPRENLPALVETTAYLAENGTHLLIAFDARDPDPGSIRAYLRDRDSAYNDDFVGVVLDTFNDERRAFEFFANPLGVQMDLIQDDVNRSEDDSWDAIWDSAGRLTPEGFAVEMAIPFSQLRFPRGGLQTWGIDVLRFRPRETRARISNNALDRGRNCYLCQFQKFSGFAAAEPGKALQIVPTLTSGRTDRVPEGQLRGLDRGDFDSELGVGVRWGITPDVTADLALNPDFSQVEADVAELEENTQFALLYPESRPFFLEGADYFASPLRAVFTRTVADPDVGIKLTGRSDVNTFGIFAAEDEATNLLFPGALGSRTGLLDQGNRAVVGRYTRAFGNGSTAGALLTRRTAGDYRNEVAGVDGRYRISDAHSIRYQYLASETEYPDALAEQFEQPFGELTGGALRVDYTFSTRAWYATVDHRRFDAGFRADAGFIPRVDIEQQNFEMMRIWHGAEGDWWTQLRVGAEGSNTRDSSGTLLARSVSPFVSMQGPLQSFLQLGVGPHEENWDGRLFNMHAAELFGQLRPRSGLNVSLFARRGEQIDYANGQIGEQLRLQPQIDWNVSRRLLLRLRHTSDRLRRQDGETLFDAALSDVRLTWQFNVHSFVRLTVQRQRIERNAALYRDATDPSSLSLGTQLLYSYKLNPQTVFFAGYADNRHEDDLTGLMVRTDRTLFFKLGYAWIP